MSDDGTTNGQTAATAPAQPLGQQLIINAQYVKDLSFENPHAPQSLRPQQGQPNVEINVDVKAQSMGPENFEVVLSINASAKMADQTMFLIELAYGAVITVRNVAQEILSAVILVETPRLMFPFARNIIADVTRDGGFPPLMINPIDFGELLRRNQEQAANQPAPSATA